MDRPRVSLIVATLGRDWQVESLLASLGTQSMRAFEVLVVDQNPDDRLGPIIERFSASMAIRWIRELPGLSRSRNAGMAQAHGAILGFPDDDCRYEPDTLARVVDFFATCPEADGLSGRALASAGEDPPARFARQAQWMAADTVFQQGISCTIFLRRALADRVGPFDERLGLGANTPWKASEETDYLLRALRLRGRIHYEPSLTVYHPGRRGPYGSATIERGRSYGRAMGHVLRKHGTSRIRFAWHLMRPAGGALIAFLRGRADKARYHLAVLHGRWTGWRDPLGDGGIADRS